MHGEVYGRIILVVVVAAAGRERELYERFTSEEVASET
jgi:hypothetical protein